MNHEKALCLGAWRDGRTWFPSFTDEHGHGRSVVGQVFPEAARATLVCRRCPERDRCLAEAVERGESDGVWGGEFFQGGHRFRRWMSEHYPERSAAPYVKRPGSRETCGYKAGSAMGIKLHAAANESNCEECREWQRRYRAAWKAEREQQAG